MFKKAVTVAALTGALALTGGTAFAFGGASTSLSNGTLSVYADDGCNVSGNCSLFYSQTSYKKTGGSSVSIQLAVWTDNRLRKTDAMTVSSGQTKTNSWGGIAKSESSSTCNITGYMVASTGKYYTPPVSVC
ncbi:hypothetical protein [Streptomyces violascens]|uniref:Secreted protein n=1 Tax=Streptomyces violascens TaxID=67381 RepID=A0ABQ3QX82_9ACTN|nr:hypothetical protein [Streptomyces violascens]GGU13070.1 hypothetical protein GCM10010289_38380 [Streptomyces violascens]GHI41888.1 hypothetical protein Sviol_62960 [Streptomyces violascens]